MYRVAAPALGIHLRHFEPATICVDCPTPRTEESGC
jgi:hypothetical protein